ARSIQAQTVKGKQRKKVLIPVECQLLAEHQQKQYENQRTFHGLGNSMEKATGPITGLLLLALIFGERFSKPKSGQDNGQQGKSRRNEGRYSIIVVCDGKGNACNRRADDEAQAKGCPQ